jgi:uncharacterized protein DUF998
MNKKQTKIMLRRPAFWAMVGIAGELLFTATWLTNSFLQGPGYSTIRDDISEMGALTAPHPHIFLVIQAIAGIATMCFILFGLRLVLKHSDKIGTLGIPLAVISTLQDISDAFFRLDCRVADGCTVAQTTQSGHAQIHALIGFICLIALIGAPFMLARRFAILKDWQHLVVITRITGIVIVLAIILTALPQTASIHGLTERAAALIAALWSMILARNILHISNNHSG